jgi:hypothetical protein
MFRHNDIAALRIAGIAPIFLPDRNREGVAS